jgi:hypothetical protein
VTTGHESRARPDRQRHETVMDDVQQRHLRKLLSCNEAKLKIKQN